MKSYNTRGDAYAGKVLVGNWYEEREWKEDPTSMKRTGHGDEMLLYQGREQHDLVSEAHTPYCAPNPKRRKVPPRQTMMKAQYIQKATAEIKEEQNATECNQMYFTRDRYLERLPKYDPNLKLDYLGEKPITYYTEKGLQKPKDSHFTCPIQDYIGHKKVKDD